jgi:hypothetical protein
MNSNTDALIQSIPAILYVIAGIFLLVLAVSWLFLPWTISGNLTKLVRIQQAQLDELERITRNTRLPGSTSLGPSSDYKSK